MIIHIYMIFSIVITVIVDYYIICIHIIMGNPILTWRIWRYPHDSQKPSDEKIHGDSVDDLNFGDV